MLSAVHFADITNWAETKGLEIVIIATGTALIGRAIHCATKRYVGLLRRRAVGRTEDPGAPDEELAHLHSLAQAAEWTIGGVLYFVASLLVISRFNLPLTSLVAPATAIGAAIGFGGSQRVVQDLLAGFFLFAERQYGFGDVVQLSTLGDSSGISGTVEEVTLRTTRLRTVRGELVIVPNGAVQQVINRSRDWSRVIIDVPVSLDTDLDLATDVMRREAAAVAEDPEWSSVLLDAPVVAGVESIQAGYAQLRVTARTLPTRQADVGRELRRRIAQGLREAGVVSPASLP